MRLWLAIVLYQVRLLVSWFYLIPVGVIVLGHFYLASQASTTEARWLDLVRLVEIGFPPVGALLVTPLILIEQEERTISLIGATPTSLLRLFGLRFLLVYLYLTMLMAVLLFLNRSLLASGSWLKLALGVAGPTLFLGMLGAFVAHWVVDSRVGYIVSIGYWLLNVLFPEWATNPGLRYVYLFSVFSEANPQGWQTNQFVLLSMAAVLFWGNLWLLNKAERFIV